MADTKAPTLAMLPWWPRDYLASTRGLTLEERGALTDLLFQAWDLGGRIPRDPERLALMLGITAENFLSLWPAIEDKFISADDGKSLINLRLERERANSLEKRQASSSKAQRAARQRWNGGGNAPGNASSNASGNAPSIKSTARAPKSEEMLGAMPEQCPPAPAPAPASSSESAPAHLEGDRGNLEKLPPRTRAQIGELIEKTKLDNPGCQPKQIAEHLKPLGVTIDHVFQHLRRQATGQ